MATTVMSRMLLTAVLAAAVMILTPGAASACSCAEPPPVEQARTEASAVFAGEIVEVRETGRDVGGRPEQLIATVEVDRVWDGRVARTVDVGTPWDGGLCGLGFETGQRWLFYASGTGEDGYRDHVCGRSALLASAEEDLAALGSAQEPVAGEQRGADPKATWVLPAAVAAGLTAVVTVVLLVLRIRGGQRGARGG